MDTASPILCPKCNYARTAADSSPAWQCPSCGIAYNKFKDSSGSQADKETAARGPAADFRERTLSLSVGQGDTAGSTAWTVYGGGLFAVFFLVFFSSPSDMAKWLLAANAVCALIAVCAFLFWLSAYRRLRMVTDVPSSTIAAAAQGYVELQGTAVAAPGDALTAHLSRVPCIWYRYESGGAAAERHVNLKVAYTLAAQERDKAAYIARYDANQDGKVDRQEVAPARGALRREAMKEYVGQGGVHSLGPSPDGRPFLVIGASHERIASRYRRLAMAHLCVFFASIGLAAYIWGI